MAYSHSIPSDKKLKKNVLDLRNKALSNTIDEFVIDQAKKFLERYEAYQQLADNHNVLVLRYEDMIIKFPEFVDIFLDYCGLKVCEKGYKVLMSYNQFKAPENENIKSNKRQVISGDHRRKLKPETIEKLNSIFKDVPIALGG